MFNQSPFNAVVFNGTAGPADPTKVTLEIVQQSVRESGKAALLIVQESVAYGRVSLDIVQQSMVASKRAQLEIIQESVAYGRASLEIVQQSLPANITRSDIVGWSVKVEIEGKGDVSARLVGDGRVDAERGMSRVAEFKLVPLPGQVDTLEYYRKSVSIDFVYHSASGQSIYDRLFSGRILEPGYDVDARLLTFICSDMLQERLDAMDQARLDTEIGGYFSEAIYDPALTGWDRAQIMTLSQVGSYDLDRDGTGQFYQWGQGAVTHSFNSSQYVAGSVEFDQANAGEIHNVTTIKFDYRFTRKRYRNYTYSWEMQPTVGCEFLTNPFQLPQRSMIQSACESTGWKLESLKFIDLPEPQPFECMIDGQIHYFPFGSEMIGGIAVDDPDLPLLCQGFHAKFSKRWVQTVTEQYEVTVRSAESVALLGEISRDISSGVETEFDGDAWELAEDEDRHLSTAQLSNTGDLIRDVDDETVVDRTEMEHALKTIKAVTIGEMLESHRQNYVSWDVMLDPTVERHHMAALVADGIDVSGQVYQVVHHFNIQTGGARTNITVDLSRIGATAAEGVGTIPAIQPPQQPDSDLGTADPDAHGGFFQGSATMHIGGSVISPPYDDTWDGYTTNYGFDEFNDQPFNPDAPTAEMYPVRFDVPTPAIESELRQVVEVSADPEIINLTVPVDRLIYT
ncbi:MAG: hypothetical protein KZQ93_15775 [Candidatus Thiodiazotropha sp. (ex Monitilora ramsayi)]|nr:hypothetical protein [Candidatus Thiodiazotropha sp. (ex Monitilora ramsayi)]